MSATERQSNLQKVFRPRVLYRPRFYTITESESGKELMWMWIVNISIMADRKDLGIRLPGAINKQEKLIMETGK